MGGKETPLDGSPQSIVMAGAGLALLLFQWDSPASPLQWLMFAAAAAGLVLLARSLRQGLFAGAALLLLAGMLMKLVWDDVKRDKADMKATVLTLEYDPNRTAHIALVQYEDGEKRYIIAPNGLKVGDTVVSGKQADIKPGNALPMASIPTGTFIHNIELYPGKGAQLARSAGVMAQLMAKENGMALVRLPSGELRNIPEICIATIGQVGNVDSENVNYGKAGRRRHMGWRPTVRGSVMNPCDHPHGGGEGKSPVGRPGPVTPWGKPALGYKTRAKHNRSDKFIVKRRNAK